MHFPALSDCQSLVQDTNIPISGVHGKRRCRHGRMSYAALYHTDLTIAINFIDVQSFKSASLAITPDILGLCVFTKLVWVVVWMNKALQIGEMSLYGKVANSIASMHTNKLCLHDKIT